MEIKIGDQEFDQLKHKEVYAQLNCNEQLKVFKERCQLAFGVENGSD